MTSSVALRESDNLDAATRGVDISAMTMSERELSLLRRMTPARKLEVMGHLIRQAYELKAAGLRALHREWSDEEIEAETRRQVGGDVP